MGGTGDYPSYDTNYTALNYSETLRLVYDDSKLSYADVLDAYWKFAPQPTDPQSDPAYMLRIFVQGPEEEQIAQNSIHKLEARLNMTVYAEILNASNYQFWKASEEHQQYFYKSGMRCGNLLTGHN